MTREEAIELLDNLIGMVEDNQHNDYDEAFKMGIKALENQKNLEEELKDIKTEIEKHNIADFIAVQSVLDILNKYISDLKGE